MQTKTCPKTCSLKTAKFDGITRENFIEQDTSSTSTAANKVTKPKKENTFKISLQSLGKFSETAKTLSEVQDPIAKESINNSVNCSCSAQIQQTLFVQLTISPQTTPNLEIQSLLKVK